MNEYVLCGMVIDSDICLPELPRISGEPAAWELRLGSIDSLQGEHVHDWFLADGTLWASCLRHPLGYVLRFPDLADFLVSANSSTVVAAPLPRTTGSTLRHLFLDQVFPQALATRGEIVLHGAAVCAGEAAIAFLGPAGRGKSTLAASFAAAGHRVLSDDCLLIRGQPGSASIVTSYPGLRLWPDAVAGLGASCRGRAAKDVAHYTEKQRIATAPLPPFRSPFPLSHIFLLADEEPAVDSAIRATRVEGHEAIMELVKHAYRLDVCDATAASTQLDRLALVAASCPVSRLSYPRTFERLKDVREAILETPRRALP